MYNIILYLSSFFHFDAFFHASLSNAELLMTSWKDVGHIVSTLLHLLVTETTKLTPDLEVDR